MSRARGRAFWILLVAPLGLFCCSTGVRGQVPTPLAQPSLQLMTEGKVEAIARTPDGGIVFGGEFSFVNGVPRANIARLQPDGTLDQMWNPGADGGIFALAVGPDGSIYAGGYFHRIGGQDRQFLAKLQGSGTGPADPTWNPNPNSLVHSLAVDVEGNVYVGGQFGFLGKAARRALAKLSGSGSGDADPIWDPSPDGFPISIAPDNAGSVFISGNFYHVGELVRHYLAKISAATGVVDANWNPDPQYITASLVAANGSLFVGGFVSRVNPPGAGENVAKISTSTGVIDASWFPEPDAPIYALAPDGNGNLYLAGDFYKVGDQKRRFLAKVPMSGTGALDSSWDPGEIQDDSADALPIKSLVVSGGKVFIGGQFSSIGGQTRLALATLASDTGAPLAESDVGNAGRVNALLSLPEGGMIVGGDFFLADPHVVRRHLLRLNSNGTLDPNWNVPTDRTVHSLALDPDHSIYVGGGFFSVGGYERIAIAKLVGPDNQTVDENWDGAHGELMDQPDGVRGIAVGSSDALYVATTYYPKKLSRSTGTTDAVWNAWTFSGALHAIVVDRSDNDAVYLGGEFSQVNGIFRYHLARVAGSGIGALDMNWNPNPADSVNSLLLDGSGHIYVGGRFLSIGGQQRAQLARVFTSGAGLADPDWNSSFAGEFYNGVQSMVSAGNTIYATGGFLTEIQSASIGSIMKLSMDTGAVDPAWNPKGDAEVHSLAIGDDGSVYAGGSFQFISSTPRYALAAFPASTPDPVFANGFESTGQ